MTEQGTCTGCARLGSERLVAGPLLPVFRRIIKTPTTKAKGLH